ncbi:YheC/YheD family protein [Metabacillus idriensis]|uniref:YheC/YheD family endospore coat-associated protein n=1 Tax=Metabacillus idriensis TaxID=324768 RepID=UPI00174C1849|nr:YheC/YheD family protein [Metabacillus idriensis]
MNHSYDIIISPITSKTIILPALAAHEISEDITQVIFGTACSPCHVTFKENGNSIEIARDLADNLKLSYGKSKIFFHRNAVYLGPLIGIFTAGFTDSILRPIGDRSLFFAKYLTAQKSLGMFAFVFGAHLINWETGSVNGYIFDDDGWRQIEVPLPNAVYDRLPNRRMEDHRALKIVKDRLTTEYGIPWFNPGFFDKWTIHQLLLPYAESSQYLPDTKLAPTLEDLEEMLQIYKSVYLKPRNGSMGHGVFQLIFSPSENVYYCRYRSKDEDNILRKYKTLDLFLKHSFGNQVFDDYLLQERVKLMKINGQQVDFRVHTNKDSAGIWNVTAIAAKIAGKGSMTTHLDNGGMVKTLKELFKNEDERRFAFHSLSAAATLISETIDREIKGFIGEIGFDLGIDSCKKVWLFEANSKPGRSIFSHPLLKEADLLSRQLSLQYATYLSKKTIQDPESLYE